MTEALLIRRGKRKGQKVASVRPEVKAQLEMLGRERALIYKTLVLTGLRKGELASLTLGQLDLDAPVAYAVLEAADEKNRQGCGIPIQSDLASDLRQWIEGRLKVVQEQARRQGGPIPVQLPPWTTLFNVPAGLIRILDRDLVMAGIARLVKDERTAKVTIDKRDDRGRTVDVHALRTTFGTHLSKGGVPLRTAQAAMRHSKPELTANVYTDPRLLDVAGALAALPALALDPTKFEDRKVATGTNDAAPFAPAFAPTCDVSDANRTTAGKLPLGRDLTLGGGGRGASVAPVNRKTPLTFPVSGVHHERAKGLEPSTASLEG